MFQGIVIDTSADGGTYARLRFIPEDALPAAAVLVRVHYSTLNYKDALAITGRAPIVRHTPMVPGIDLVGVIEHSHDPRYHAGDAVILNGWGAGEKHWGGLAQLARVPADWLLPLPAGLSLWQAAAIGTAGYTAMLCVMALERHGLTPADGEVAVTGASGGVGGMAISLLAKRGYRVTAITSDPVTHQAYLLGLGAAEILSRHDVNAAKKPLSQARWAGAIDVAGGQTLANLCASMAYGGVVVACGIADSMALPASMAPFILRGLTLAGIDSVMCTVAQRQQAWTHLAATLDQQLLARLSTTIPLSDTIDAANRLLSGQVRGRLVVDLRSDEHRQCVKP